MRASPILAALLAVAILAMLAACSGSRAEGLDPTKVPADLRADYELFARRCSKCHSLARPLGAGITDDAQWVMYVSRMRRQPASGISHEEQEPILRFLRWHAASLRARTERRDAPPSPPPAELASDGGAP